MRHLVLTLLLLTVLILDGRADGLARPALPEYTPAAAYGRLLLYLPPMPIQTDPRWTEVTTLLSQAGLRVREQLPLEGWALWQAQVPLDRTTYAALSQAVAARLPGARLQPNYRYRPVLRPADPDYNLQWAVHNTGQNIPYPADSADEEDPSSAVDRGSAGVDIALEQAWDLRADANGVVVAILDSGLAADTPDLAGAHLVAGYDYCENDSDTDDDVGHGTAIAALLAAAHDDYGIAGVAPRASIMPLRFIGNRFPTEAECTSADAPQSCDCNYTTAAIKAIEYAIAHNVDVINMSFGGSEEDPALRDALQAAVDAGILLVAAAGNEGQNLNDTPAYPASFEIPGMLSVAAHTNNGNLSSFSNYGAVIHLAAPGSSIWLPNPNAVDRFAFDNFNDLPDSEGLIDEAYRLDIPDASDFDLSAPGRWGVAELITGDKVAVLDIERVYNGQEGYSPSAVGIWTSDDVSVASSTQVRAEIFAELAGNDRIYLEASTNNFDWVAVAIVQGEFAAPIEVPMSEIFDGGTDHVRIRIRPDISRGSDTGLSGGAYISRVQLWQRSDAASAELDPYSFIQGTSFAAPYVAGVAALILAQTPGLPPVGVAARILAGTSSLATADENIPSNRRLNAAGALDMTPRLFIPGTDRFRHRPHFPSAPESGEDVEFRVSYIDPGSRPIPETIALDLQPAADGDPLELAMQQVVTQATAHYYEYAVVYRFTSADNWSYDIHTTLDDGTRVQGPTGELAVKQGSLSLPGSKDDDDKASGCGCSVIRAQSMQPCPVTQGPGAGAALTMLLALLGWISLRYRPSGSGPRA